MKPTKCPAREKKMRQVKQKKRGEEKAKRKSQHCCVTAHAQTSQANILHLDQKAANCTTCKRLCGRFWLFIARQWPENHSTSFKTCFLAKSPVATCNKKGDMLGCFYFFLSCLGLWYLQTRPSNWKTKECGVCWYGSFFITSFGLCILKGNSQGMYIVHCYVLVWCNLRLLRENKPDFNTF